MSETVKARDLQRARLIIGDEAAHEVTVSGHYSIVTGERLGIPHEVDECSNFRCILESARD